MSQGRENEIGALWERTSSKGNDYMSGTIDGKDVVLFRNERKTGKQPDWRVFKSEPRGERTERPATTSRRDEGFEPARHRTDLGESEFEF